MCKKNYCTLKNISIVRSGIPLLGGVSLVLNAGECFILKGKNGAGKSTLLRYIAGLDGSSTLQTTTSRIGYIGHTLALKGSMTVRESLEYTSKFFDSPANLDEVLPIFQCHTIQHSKIQNCSAGQKQRVALTRLLIEEQDIWLLDEPTTALDQNGVAIFLNVIKELQAKAAAFVIATHADLELDTMKFINLDEHKTPSVLDCT